MYSFHFLTILGQRVIRYFAGVRNFQLVIKYVFNSATEEPEDGHIICTCLTSRIENLEKNMPRCKTLVNYRHPEKKYK